MGTYSIIKRLAEAKRPCLAYAGIDFAASGKTGPLVMASHLRDCSGGCGGTGRIVPFAALRVPIREIWVNDSYRLDYIFKTEREGGHYGASAAWVPEPDVEKAGARAHAAYLHVCSQRTPEEELRAAEAWVKEEEVAKSAAELLMEVRRRMIRDYYTGTDPGSFHFWSCGVCGWVWRHEQPESHESGCPLEVFE